MFPTYLYIVLGRVQQPVEYVNKFMQHQLWAQMFHFGNVTQQTYTKQVEIRPLRKI